MWKAALGLLKGSSLLRLVGIAAIAVPLVFGAGYYKADQSWREWRSTQEAVWATKAKLAVTQEKERAKEASEADLAFKHKAKEISNEAAAEPDSLGLSGANVDRVRRLWD